MLHLHPSQILEFNEGWISRENLLKNIAFSFYFMFSKLNAQFLSDPQSLMSRLLDILEKQLTYI